MDKNRSRKKKKFKLKFAGLIVLLIILSTFTYFIYNFFTRRISNIYIFGNDYVSDWDIIVDAKLDNYPISFKNPQYIIEKRLKKNTLIRSVKVTKRGTIVTIEVEENRPIFYDNIKKKTVLTDGKTVDQIFDVPTLSCVITENQNEQPSKCEITIKMYNSLLNGLSKLEKDILMKISEITYSPDGIDEEKFLFTMTDGNYVYITLKKINLISDYNNIVKEFNNKKGILYLNSGGYFKIMEN